MLKVQPSQVAAGGGNFYVVATPSQTVSFSTVLTDPSLIHSVLGHASARFPEGNLEAMTFGANFVEIQVDTGTGNVNLLNMVYAHDAGRIINPLTATNMTRGGTIQGIGFAMGEEFLVDQSNGTSLTADYLNYGLPNMKSLPNITPILINAVDTLGPYGAKGIGECPIILPIATISSAIYNATGVWMDGPFTPARVLHALGKA
jgi:xanthine dehydrogenase molybdenum-binding subunit